MGGWEYILLIAACLAAVLIVCRVTVYFIRRVIYRVRLGKCGVRIRGLYPLWWLIGAAGRCSFIADTGTRRFAVALIGSPFPGTEYSLGAPGECHILHNFIMFGLHGIQMLDWGYRKLRFHKTNFEKYPGCEPIICFAPHPYAITAGMRDKNRRNRQHTVSELQPGQVWDGATLCDGSTLRALLKTDTGTVGTVQ